VELLIVDCYRLDNADQALENLHFYQNSYQTEEPWMSSLEENVGRLAAVTGSVDDAQRDVDVVMVCHVYTLHAKLLPRRVLTCMRPSV